MMLALLRVGKSDGEVAKEIIGLRLFPAASGNVGLWPELVFTCKLAAREADRQLYRELDFRKYHKS